MGYNLESISWEKEYQYGNVNVFLACGMSVEDHFNWTNQCGKAQPTAGDTIP